MIWQIFLFFPYLIFLAIPAMATSQQEQKTKPLATKEIRIKNEVDVFKMSDQKKKSNFRLSSSNHAESNPVTYSNKDAQSKMTIPAKEINQAAINELITSSQANNQKIIGRALIPSPGPNKLPH